MKSYFYTLIIRVLARFFYLFPIKKSRVVLTSFNGRRYSCNPKYIAEELLRNGNFEVVFAIRSGVYAEMPADIKRVTYKSLKHFYYLMTARYIVVNSTGLAEFLPYRKTQILINTWHGGGYFKVAGIGMNKNKFDIALRKLTGKNIDVYLSNGDIFSEVQSNFMCVPIEKFRKFGFPRNDLFFKDCPNIKERVREYYRIPLHKKIILYAPTYRDGDIKKMTEYGFTTLDTQMVIDACRRRFNEEFVFLFRAHHNMLPDSFDEGVINASEYPDIQELLYSAEIFISDYSSCMWDYALQNRPGFLYVPDLENYQKVHPLGTSVDTWPYPAANTNEMLEKLILDYDEARNNEKIKSYFEMHNNYDDGNATNRLMKYVFTYE